MHVSVLCVCVRVSRFYDFQLSLKGGSGSVVVVGYNKKERDTRERGSDKRSGVETLLGSFFKVCLPLGPKL
jgi:hypothetical protein